MPQLVSKPTQWIAINYTFLFSIVMSICLRLFLRLSAQDVMALFFCNPRMLLKNGSYRQAAQEFEFLLDSMPDNVLVKNDLKLMDVGKQETLKEAEAFLKSLVNSL